MKSYLDKQKATTADGSKLPSVTINYYDDNGTGYLSMDNMVDENGNPLPGLNNILDDAKSALT